MRGSRRKGATGKKRHRNRLRSEFSAETIRVITYQGTPLMLQVNRKMVISEMKSYFQ